MSNDVKIKKKRKIFQWGLLLLLLPSLIYLAIFCYAPLYGLVIAFKDYNPFLGVLDSPTVGLKHFINFFAAPNFWQLIGNTLRVSVIALIVNMPLPIILALLINEIRSNGYKKAIQTISYAPFFVSNIVLCGMCFSFLSVGTGDMGNGLIVRFFELFGWEAKRLMSDADAFLWIYIISGLWQGLGWWSIIYVGTLSNVSRELHEAAMIDGAGRMCRIRVINLPVIVPIAVIQLLLNIGQIMNINFERIFMLQTAGNLEKSETISTYIYRITLMSQYPQYSFSTAVGIFNMVVNVVLLYGANFISKKLGQESIL